MFICTGILETLKGNKLKILITGVAGFIGFRLAEELLKNGHTVYGVDNLNNYYSIKLKIERLKILNKHKFFFIFKKLILIVKIR